MESKMAKKSFNGKKILEQAAAGELSTKEIKAGIKRAAELGLLEIAKNLGLYVYSSTSFAGDAAPAELKERAAKGISILKGMGRSLNRTTQMLQRHGILESINRVSNKTGESTNFDLLAKAGYVQYTAEAIVVDFAEYFSEKTVAKAKEKLESAGHLAW